MATDAPAWLLLLHGFTGRPESWERVRARLAHHVPVFAPALLGHESTAGQTPIAHDFEAEVARLASWVADRSEAPGHVCGYSLGARLALALVVRFPRRFTSATLIGVNPGLSSEADREARRRADARWQELLRTRGLEVFASAWQEQPLFKTQAQLLPQLLARQHEIRLAHSAEGLARSLEVLGLGQMPDYFPMLHEVELPIELLCGELDTHFVDTAQKMAGVLDQGRLTRVPDCGHNLLLEAPEVVAEVLNRGISN